MKIEQDIGGFTVITSEHTRTVWQGEELLLQLPGDATDAEIDLWAQGYGVGFEAGCKIGRRQLQHELRRLIGAA